MKIKLYTFILSCFLTGIAFSQTTSDSPFNLRLGYVGTIIYPGVTTGAEFPVKYFNKEKIKKPGDTLTITKRRHLTTDITWYHHKGFHDHLAISAGYIWRRERPGGFFSEFAPALGYSFTVPAGTQYQVDENGRVTEIGMKGYHHMHLMLAGGIGKRLNSNYSFFLSGRLMTLIPYNSTIYLRPMLVTGLIYHFIKRN